MLLRETYIFNKTIVKKLKEKRRIEKVAPLWQGGGGGRVMREERI